jgi:hypothetical protein
VNQSIHPYSPFPSISPWEGKNGDKQFEDHNFHVANEKAQHKLKRTQLFPFGFWGGTRGGEGILFLAYTSLSKGSKTMHRNF